jgi:non-ribosomal peptide synthetase component E (peptide arylation enzyme)
MNLPGLVKGGATLRAGAPALVEAEGLETLMGRPARQISCRDLGLAVDTLALRLRTLGIRPGEVVITHLPNTAEALISLIAIQKLGALPAPLPVFADASEIAEAASLVRATALISITEFAGIRGADTARAAAAASMDVRLVAAFGAGVPEGVAGLDDWPEVAHLGKAGFPKLDGNLPAVITFDRIGGALRALLRSHEQLVAEAAGIASQARVNAGTRLIMPLPPASAAGIVLGIALPLLAGAELNLIPLFDSCRFAELLGNGERTTVILPAAAAASYENHSAERATKAECLVLVHRPQPGEALDATAAAGRDARLIDLICLGEALLIASARAVHAAPGQLALRAAAGMPGILAGDKPGYGLALERQGTIEARGPLVPQAHAGAGDRLDTGFYALQADRRLVLGARAATSAA